MHDRNEKRQILVNAGSNVAVMVAKIALVFFVSPILIHKLGDARYGAWMFVSSITAYLLLGDFGVKIAVMRFVARFDGLKDPEGINRIFNTSLALLSVVGATLLGAALLFGHFWGLPLKVPSEIRAETADFFILQAILVAMLLPISLPNALLAGLGRFPARNAISLVSLVMRQGLLVGVVWYGGGLVAIGAVLVMQCALDFGMSYVGARLFFPQLRFSFRYVDRKTLRTILGYGGNVFLGDLATMVIAQSSFLIIGALVAAPDLITYYSIGSSLRDYTASVLATIVLVLNPAVSKWQALGKDDAIRSVLAHTVRYVLYAALAVELGLVILGYPFISLWMGRRYADAGYLTLLILAASLVFSSVAMVAARFLEGIGRVRPLAIVTVLQAMLTVGLSIGLASHFGIEGVAVGFSLATMVAACGVVFVVCRSLELRPLPLIVGASWAPVAAAAPAALIWILGARWFPIENWLGFFAVGFAGMTAFTAMVVILDTHIRRAAIGAARIGAGWAIHVYRIPVVWLGTFRS